jgi:hypothetical protein
MDGDDGNADIVRSDGTALDHNRVCDSSNSPATNAPPTMKPASEDARKWTGEEIAFFQRLVVISTFIDFQACTFRIKRHLQCMSFFVQASRST